MPEFPPIEFVEKVSLLKIAEGRKPFVLVDENTSRHCLNEIPLPDDAVVIEVKAGEEHKNLSACEKVWEELSKHRADRSAVLINLGGGMICDLGGFAASCYKRGIAFVNVPTSLLAMADAAVGGKTGIDFLHFKNQIGLFANAEKIVIHAGFLQTLPERELVSGLAEVIKHYIIADEASFSEIVANGIPNTQDVTAWKSVIQKAVEIKMSVVKEDPFERGVRKKLNFGHTVGHAVESYFLRTKTPLLHGEAIAVGMVCELLIAAELKIIAGYEAEKAVTLLQKIFSPMVQLTEIDFIVQLTKQDKKNADGKTLFALPNRIGHCLINCEVGDDVIHKSLMMYNERFAA